MYLDRTLTKEEFDNNYGQISGFMQLDFGNDYEGSYYHENPIQDGEWESEILDYWFSHLFDVVSYLRSGKKYVAFTELGKTNQWIEFKRKGSNLLVNIGVDRDSVITELQIVEDKHCFQYEVNNKYIIECNEFYEEVTTVGINFIRQLYSINPELINTKMFKYMNKDFIDINNRQR